TSRSSERESSTASRNGSSGGGYNSSCRMGGAFFLAIKTGQLSSGNRQREFTITRFEENEIAKKWRSFAQGPWWLVPRERRLPGSSVSMFPIDGFADDQRRMTKSCLRAEASELRSSAIPFAEAAP